MLSCIFVIVTLFDFAELQRRAKTSNIDALDKLSLILLHAPHLLEHTLPFLVFMAALYVFWRFNRTSELIVCRAAGLSLWRLILPVGLIAVCVGCIDLAAFNPLSSALLARYEHLQRKLLSPNTSDIWIETTGLWLSEKKNHAQTFYRADHLNMDSLTFKNMNILIFSPTHKFTQRIDAKTAQVQGKNLILLNGWETMSNQAPRPFNTKTLETSLSRERIEEMTVDKSTLSFWKLPSYVSLLEASGLKSLKPRMAWHSLVANVIWFGAMVLLAASFACGPIRYGKPILLLTLGILFGFFLYIFKYITFAFGSSGGLPPLIAAWLPPLLTLMVGATLVFNQEDG